MCVHFQHIVGETYSFHKFQKYFKKTLLLVMYLKRDLFSGAQKHCDWFVSELGGMGEILCLKWFDKRTLQYTF